MQQNFEVPKNLIFNTRELIRVLPLKCMAKLEPQDLEKSLGKLINLKRAVVKLNFSAVSKKILIHGKVEGTIEVECSRCLKKIEQEFNEEFYETLSTSVKEIDIMNIIQQTLVLVNEIQYLCSDKCKGLCFICGENRNIKECKCKVDKQSPFAVLKDKFNKKKEGK